MKFNFVIYDFIILLKVSRCLIEEKKNLSKNINFNLVLYIKKKYINISIDNFGNRASFIFYTKNKNELGFFTFPYYELYKIFNSFLLYEIVYFDINKQIIINHNGVCYRLNRLVVKTNTKIKFNMNCVFFCINFIKLKYFFKKIIFFTNIKDDEITNNSIYIELKNSIMKVKVFGSSKLEIFYIKIFSDKKKNILNSIPKNIIDMIIKIENNIILKLFFDENNILLSNKFCSYMFLTKKLINYNYIYLNFSDNYKYAVFNRNSIILKLKKMSNILSDGTGIIKLLFINNLVKI